jgi:hypothetical protein
VAVLGIRKRARRPDARAALSAQLEGEPVTVWAYKAEGAANVTFSYTGSAAALRGRILRVRKQRLAHHGVAEPSAPRGLLPTDGLEYAMTVMRPRIGEQYVVPGVRVPVSRRFLHALADHLASGLVAAQRPAKRRRDTIDAAVGVVVLMADHSLLPEGSATERRAASSCGNGSISLDVCPSVCVELKPKCGLPVPGCAACRYCMHQVVKGLELATAAAGSGRGTGAAAAGSTGSVATQTGTSASPAAAAAADAALIAAAAAHVSGFCPLDLYSHEEARVARALWALADSPQNNFRLFVDGRLAYAAELLRPQEGAAGSGDALGELEATLQSRLPHLAALRRRQLEATSGGGNGGVSTAYPAVAALLALLCRILLHDRVLERLRAAQRVAGPSSGVAAADGDGHAAADALQVYVRHAPAAAAAPDSSGGQVASDADVRALAALAPAVEASLAASACDEGSGGADAAGAWDAAYLRDYLAAATAKDCSVMLAFSLLPGEAAGASGSDPSATSASAAWPDDDERARSAVPDEGPSHWRRTLRVADVAASDGRHAGRGPGAATEPLALAYSIAVVDLDPKPLARIPHYARLEAQLAATFAECGPQVFAAAGKRCGQAEQ